MDILHFCLSLSFSGLEQYALELASDQKSRGRDVWFAVSRGSQLESECQKRQIPAVSMNFYSPMGLSKVWREMRQVFARHPELKILHLHSTQEVLHVALPLLASGRVFNSKPKVILQTHLWINHKKRDPYHRLLYSVVDELWCSSEMAKKSLTEAIPLGESKIRVIKYGRDVSNIEQNFLSRDEARKVLSLPSDAVVIGTVSRIEPSKGIRELAEAVLPLVERDDKIHLVVIGGASPADESAARYSSHLKEWWDGLDSRLRNRIHFQGTVRDSYKLLKAFDLYVLPSYQETFSLSLLDAQLAGLPVIGSASGGTPDVVLEGRTGWLFRPRDIESMREKLKEAFDKRESWRGFGAAAAARVRADFDQKDVFESILDTYGAF